MQNEEGGSERMERKGQKVRRGRKAGRKKGWMEGRKDGKKEK